MFGRNRELLAECGLFYPAAPGETDHVGLVQYASASETRISLRSTLGLPTAAAAEAFDATLMQLLQDEIVASGCARVLLSGAQLSTHVTEPEDVRKLVNDLRRICPQIRVIVYLRPHHELALSAYSQAVKSGYAKPMTVVLDENCSLYDYDMMLSRWEKAVGIENITVRLLRRDEFADGSLIADFFRALDMKMPANLELPGRLNRSFDAYTLEFARITNAMTPREDRVGADPWLRNLQAALERISAGPQFTAAGPELAELDRRFAASNAEVARRYFPERNGVLFVPFNEAGRQDSPKLTARKVVELTLELWREAAERQRQGQE
jgi:hypothetical protein